MTLAAGTRLGPYAIVGPLGAGGMGEVYRARDTRLDRDVAIKVLPAHLADTPEIRARFEREARTISSLNHPNICSLFDVGHEGTMHYLVMELVEGETLAQRIARGPLPLAELLRLGAQIAEALDRAHRAGVVHRDLKPGNVMLTRAGAKLMDFGLARGGTGMAGPAGASGVTVTALTQSPTVATPLTTEGTLIGTYQYMAPEQLEGREADARSDVWALGCVLYEMATGRRAFDGRSQASLIGAIMSTDPAPISLLTPMTPPALDRLVAGCLTKDAEERIQTAHDVKLQLAWIADGGSQAAPAPVVAPRRRREPLLLALLGAMTLVAVALGALLVLRPKPPARPVIFELTPPAQVGFVDLPRISPDGRRLAFNATDSTGTSSIWVRAMNSLTAERLPGTEGATRPFWSPDGRWLAFFSGGKLRKIDITGGSPQTLCDATRGADGTWSHAGVILFDGSTADSVMRVSSGGGTPTGATRVDRKAGESYTAWPQFLPDGRHFLYLAYSGGPETAILKVGRLDSWETRTVGPASSRVEFAAGHLLSVRQGTLLAQAFDARGAKTRGDPFPVAENVEQSSVGSARFSASDEGTLVYRSGGGRNQQRLVWVNRRGQRLGTVGATATFKSPMLSPDGTQLAVTLEADGTSDIWVWDLARDLGTRLTFGEGPASDAVWTPDGSGIVFSRSRGPVADLYLRRLGATGADSLMLKSDEQKFGYAFTPDGRSFLYIMRSNLVRRFNVMSVSMETGKTSTLLDADYHEFDPALSPDGRWLAYSSLESGRPEVYARAFLGSGLKTRISSHGGSGPQWRRDGRELFYLSNDRVVMSVAVTPGDPPRFALPQKLFDTVVPFDEETRNRFLAMPAGDRFLLVSQEGERKLGATTVVLDWPSRHSR